MVRYKLFSANGFFVAVVIATGTCVLCRTRVLASIVPLLLCRQTGRRQRGRNERTDYRCLPCSLALRLLYIALSLCIVANASGESSTNAAGLDSGVATLPPAGVLVPLVPLL